MTSIIYVGMDVHTTNYTLRCYSVATDNLFATATMEPDYMNIIKYLDRVNRELGEDIQFECGYEAGCLGYSLYHQLARQGINCTILAPTTMATARKKKGVKNDKRDAADIAKCLAYNTYSPVYVPTGEDNAVKEYIRMRNDAKDMLKRIKQQLLAFCTRNGKRFAEGSAWTQKHIAWLGKLDFGDAILNETLREYLTLYRQAADKVELYDLRITEMSKAERYAEKVKKLECFIGVKDYTALATIVEIGDFARFQTAQNFSSYIGLVPGEDSSGNSVQITGITKAGNSHVRKMLIEAAQCYSRGGIGVKGKALKARQAGNDPKVIAYADRANERLKRKCYRIMCRSKRNIAVTAVARELACFIWGMMTDNIA